MDWRPIDTAPKDGSRILAFGKLGFEPPNGVGTVSWCKTYNLWSLDPSEATEYGPEACIISHWQPLPDPPKE